MCSERSDADGKQVQLPHQAAIVQTDLIIEDSKFRMNEGNWINSSLQQVLCNTTVLLIVEVVYSKNDSARWPVLRVATPTSCYDSQNPTSPYERRGRWAGKGRGSWSLLREGQLRMLMQASSLAVMNDPLSNAAKVRQLP